MCGIAGVYSFVELEKLELARIVRAMNLTLSHRGPDSEGEFISDRIALAHRRLSILDLSSAGHQPMRDEESATTIVYNGEVYNFKVLREELKTKGYVFRGGSDTEVVLCGYREWGLDLFVRLEGIFSLAIWDESAKSLILARDRLGVKPLFFSRKGDYFLFGSEIKAILATELIDKNINQQAFAEYLWFGNSFEDRTFYADIQNLLPGHCMVVSQNGIQAKAWWKLEDCLSLDIFSSTAECEARILVRNALELSVRRQLVADVPVGLFLSGGIDSSAIAAVAMQVQSKPLMSFSAGFDSDGGVNELPKARSVAKLLGLDHHEIRVGSSDLEEVLLQLSQAHDEPFGDAANIPLFLMCRELKGDIKVVLQGDGGDEMFGGYRRYSILDKIKKFSYLPRVPNFFDPSIFGRKAERFLRIADALSFDSAHRMGLLLTMETLRKSPSLMLEGDALKEYQKADPFLAFKNCANRFSEFDPVQQMLLTDIVLQLPSQFLPKVDRATMSQGIESRVPLLDENIIRIALNMPASWKVKGNQRKIVLRDSVRDILPTEILDSPKVGFGVPYGEWLRTSLYAFSRDHLLNINFINHFGLNRERIENSIEDHKTKKVEHGIMLWKLLQLGLWHENNI